MGGGSSDGPKHVRGVEDADKGSGEDGGEESRREEKG